MAQVSFLTGALSLLLLVVPPVVPDEDTAPEAPVKIPISNPEVQKVVALTIKYFNKYTDNEYYFKQQDILNSEIQAVKGTKYFLTIVLVKTNCKKRKTYELKEAELEKCGFSPEAGRKKQTCKFEVWMNEKKTSHGIELWKRQTWTCI